MRGQKMWPLLLPVLAIWSVSLAWIYSRGAQPGPWIPQGVRFALALIGVMVLPVNLTLYVAQPWPREAVLKAATAESMMFVLIGLLLAAVFRNQATAR